MHLKHLALLVRDIKTARRFYEKYLGFADCDAVWHGDVLFIRDGDGFDLALMKGEHPPNPGAFHHFGFLMSDPAEVRELQRRLEADGVPILEIVEEADQVSFKGADPDGYTYAGYA